jgi:hypothetical protein
MEIIQDIQENGLFNYLRKGYEMSFVKNVKGFFSASKKIIKARNDVEFLKKCKQQEILPKFTNFRLTNNRLNQSKEKKQFSERVADLEIKNKSRRLKELNQIKSRLFDKINFEVYPIDWKLIEERLNIILQNCDKDSKKLHNKKLNDIIGKNIFDVLDDQVESNLNLSVDVINISKTELNEKEVKLLSKGLKFAVKDKKTDTYDILTNFELTCQQLNNLIVSEVEKGIEKDLKMDKKQIFFQSFQRTAMDYVKNVKKGENSLSQDELETLKILSRNKDLVIAKADKGNAVVVQDKQEYIEKMVEVLSDKTKFECIPDDPTIERESKLQRSLYSLNKAGNLPTNIYNKIRPTGSKIGTLYGLRKVHKSINPPPPGRPIISAIGTYTYDTSKYLVSILKPLRDEAKYSLKDTFDLCSRLKSANKTHDLSKCQMVSYDIVSLFTNVPIKETIDIIVEKAFSLKHVEHVTRTRTVLDRVEVKKKGRKGPNYRPTFELKPRVITESIEVFNGLERHQLRKLLVICTPKAHFQFKGNFFDQIDGVAMGCPLGPTFAEMFMAYFEEKYMKTIEEHGVVLWLRFVDDILLFIKDISKSAKLLEFLNSRHPNIKFTEEKEILLPNGASELPFLDVLLHPGSRC